MSKRTWVLLGSALPVLGLLALLGWASAQPGGNRGGLGVNQELKQVRVSPELAAEFSLDLLAGGSLSLSELRGRVVLLDFWSSWCPPCRQEAPVLAQVYREYGGQPVEFVGVDIWDKPQDAQEHIRRYQIPYPNGIDRDGVIAINYGVKGIPEKFFINRDGFLVKKFAGPVPATKLRDALNELLGPVPPPAGQ